MAIGDPLARWERRLDWSGESAVDGAVLLQRFEELHGSGTTRTLDDSADPGATWTLRNASAATAGLSAGRWGDNLSANRTNPATEQTSLTVPHFAGLWPASGQLLFKVWASLSFAMSFTPIISTRNTSGKAPLVYLSTLADGRPRAMVYSAAGSAILDQSETLPWTPAPFEWVCYLWLVDLDARTSQLAVVKRDTGQAFLGPVRNLSGVPNPACEADFEVLTLSPTAAYWGGGYIDEVGYWQTTGTDLAEVVEGVRLALPARGRDSAAGVGLEVTDAGVEATDTATLLTGARPVSWDYRPAVEFEPAPLAGAPLALLSSDNGATWSAPTTLDALPASFTGLARWQLPMFDGETLTAVTLLEQAPPPELDPIANQSAEQNDQIAIALGGTWDGTPAFAVTTPAEISASVTGTTLTVTTGWAIGEFTVSVTVTDDTGLTSAPQTFTVEVLPPDIEPAPNPIYARAPLIVYSDADERTTVIADPVAAVVVSEVNGEECLQFTLPARHRGARSLAVERIVEAAGEHYRIRRIRSYRENRVAMLEVYAEAAWYDLRAAGPGQVDARDFNGAQAGDAMTIALDGTGWTIGRVNVSTVRTWQWQGGTPLALLREIAEVHGGDLVFDNKARTVSLLTFAGKRSGLTFLYGRGVVGATRIEDTTSLVTRIIPRNADGLGIESVNDGSPYLEDYTWTDEVRTSVYDFAAGTSPFTMLAMATAALGKRARPSYSYELEVVDLSAWSGQELDRFAAGDEVAVVDAELGIEVTTRIVRLEYDLVRPWASKITLDEKPRQLGSNTGSDAAVLTTGTDIDTRDLVPFNLLRNARFDNGLAHWAASGATVVDGGNTGRRAVEFAGGGVRWIEQTVAPDTRDVYTVSLAVEAEGFPSGVTPDLEIVAEITYEDSTTETIVQRVTG